MRTHYDNLHISRHASADEIRLAYRRLSRQYHPDLNTDPDAHRIMALINQAYEVLSNPSKRAEHDQWIDAQLAAQTTTTVFRQPENVTPTILPTKNNRWLIPTIVCLAMLLIGQIVYLIHNQFNKATPTIAYEETLRLPENATSTSELLSNAPNDYIRPISAPNGNPFPHTSGYIDGYTQIRSATGKYRIFVDNVKNTSDVLVELHQLHSPQNSALRTFFILERNYFILDGLDAGTYTLRYRQLDNGEEIHSENIVLSSKNPEANLYLQRAKP